LKFLKDFAAWIAIVGALIGGALAYGGLTQDVKSHGARLEKIEPVVQANTTETAVVQAKVDAIVKALDRIEDKMGTKK
jgi:hypothetical protein